MLSNLTCVVTERKIISSSASYQVIEGDVSLGVKFEAIKGQFDIVKSGSSLVLLLGLSVHGDYEGIYRSLSSGLRPFDHLWFVKEQLSIATADASRSLQQSKLLAIIGFSCQEDQAIFTAKFKDIYVTEQQQQLPLLILPLSQLSLQPAVAAIAANHDKAASASVEDEISSITATATETVSKISSLLPTCACCLRRLKSLSISNNNSYYHHPATTASAVSPSCLQIVRSFSDYPITATSTKATDNNSSSSIIVPCIVCYTYAAFQTQQRLHRPSSSSSSSSSSLATARPHLQQPSSSSSSSTSSCVCAHCSIQTNLWTCLQCGQLGCGRYTLQHAEAHYLAQPLHHLAMELVSGRIWDYRLDRYEHLEEVPAVATSSYSSMSAAAAAFVSSEEDGCYGPRFISDLTELRTLLSTTDSTSINSSALYLVGTSYSSSSSLYHPVTGQSLAGIGGTGAGLPAQSLSKLDQISLEYEQLIEHQIQDQRLYYEKKLAREMIAAMEASYNQHYSNNVAMQPPIVQAVSSSGGSEAASTTAVQTALVGQEVEQIDSRLQEIEALKMEVSLLEEEHRQLHHRYKTKFDEIKQAKATCDLQLRKQSKFQALEADFKQKEMDLQVRCQQQMNDLKQQITDLTFYVQTQQKLQQSPLKAEISDGMIMTTVKADSKEASYNSGSKKKSNNRK